MADTQSEVEIAVESLDYEALGRAWQGRITRQRSAEDTWRTAAKNAEEAYVGRRLGAFPITYANIETMVPAIISTPPVPDIRPRHYATQEEDPLALAGAQVLERALATLTDDGKLLREMERTTQDAYLAGRATIEVERVGDVINWRAIPWNMLIVGPCDRWENAPWIAIGDSVPLDALDGLRDDKAKALRRAGGASGETDQDGDDKGIRRLWTVWDKHRRLAITMTEGGEVLKVEPDPYELPGFFPVARPVQPIELSTSSLPVCPQSLYEQQAIELAHIQRRIDGLTSALRAAGFVSAEGAELIDKLRNAPDGTLVPVPPDVASRTGRISDAIEWIPLDGIVQTLQHLYTARDQTKALIYEISGISDVIRGASDPRETATAQGIKNQWGSLRIRRLQASIEALGRDVFGIAAHMACKLSPEALAKLSGTDPARHPEFQVVVEFLAQGLDDMRIDVESGSTSRADLGAAREEMQGFLTAAAGYFQTVFPLGQMVPEAAPPLIAIFQQFSRYYRLGRQTEDAIEKFAQAMKAADEQRAQQPPQPSPQEIEAQAKQAAAEQKAQADQAKAAADAQKSQLDAEHAQHEHAAKMQELAMQQQAAQAEHAVRMEEIALEREKIALERMKLAMPAAEGDENVNVVS